MTHVEVTSLSEDVFYGNLIFRIEGQEKKIDCRPSDALALAVRLNVPILVAEEVMDQAGIVPEEDLSGFDPIEAEEALLVENGENLEVFEDFLQNINLDDLQSNSDEDKPDEE